MTFYFKYILSKKNKKSMKYLKTFESFSPINEEEEFISAVKDMISGKSAYKTTIKYLESKSKEAEEVIKIYKEIHDSGEDPMKSAKHKDLHRDKVDRINSLGNMWASKHSPHADIEELVYYHYDAVDTVMKDKWGRKYHGIKWNS